MARNIKIELNEGSVNGHGFRTVEIPMPKKNDMSCVVEGNRKVVIHNWGNNDYTVGLFDRKDGVETANVIRGNMTDAANAAAKFLY
jgi:hypothetical protein